MITRGGKKNKANNSSSTAKSISFPEPPCSDVPKSLTIVDDNSPAIIDDTTVNRNLGSRICNFFIQDLQYLIKPSLLEGDFNESAPKESEDKMVTTTKKRRRRALIPILSIDALFISGAFMKHKSILMSEKFKDIACAKFAKFDNYEGLQWAFKNRLPCYNNASMYIAFKGNMKVFKWCHRHGCPWDEITCAMAAAKGHVEVVKFAILNGCPADGMLCANAALSGCMAILQWARQRGLPWDERTTISAASGGHLEALRWSFLQGCPVNNEVTAMAAKGGHMQVRNQMNISK